MIPMDIVMACCAAIVLHSVATAAGTLLFVWLDQRQWQEIKKLPPK